MIGGEAERIREEYARRERHVPPDRYSLASAPNLFARQQKNRALLSILSTEGLLPLAGKKVLDLGCGDGQQLLEFQTWGSRPADLAGIDLIDTRIERARERLGASAGGDRGPDLRTGDASALPWPDGVFDMACQNTVFTSILDDGMKKAVAGEMLRVLKPGGALIWYDFLFNNPANPNVKGIAAREIRSLFPGCSVRLRRITLAPPIARRLVPITWIGSLMLEKLVIFNTHYLAMIRKPAGAQ